MKKITMIIPSLLLASCLFGCGKTTDPFVIESEGKFNDAITFKNDKYIQAGHLYTYLGALTITRYEEFFISPTVHNMYQRRVEGNTQYSDEYYIEKTREDGEDKYYKYTPISGAEKWKRDPCNDQEFITPTKLGEGIKNVLNSGLVNYNKIKDKYDKYRQAYYFDIVNQQGQPFSVILSFYNNRLNYFSYDYYNGTESRTEWGALSFTYSPLTPKLPPYEPTLL